MVADILIFLFQWTIDSFHMFCHLRGNYLYHCVNKLYFTLLYILKGLFRLIYIEKGQIKCFNFSFLGWGLRVTYNWDIFEKLRPPHRFSNIWIWDIFGFFLIPPPLFGTLSEIFPFFNYDASHKPLKIPLESLKIP